MTIRGLDAYITGINVRHEDKVVLTCPNGHGEWTAELYFELGGWFFTDEEDGPFCNVCGAEGEDV